MIRCWTSCIEYLCGTQALKLWSFEILFSWAITIVYIYASTKKFFLNLIKFFTSIINPWEQLSARSCALCRAVANGSAFTSFCSTDCPYSIWAERCLRTVSELSNQNFAHFSWTSDGYSSRHNGPNVQIPPPHTPPQAFHLLCHSSNHMQISCFCGSRQQCNYWFMCFISIMLFLTHLSFHFF